MTLDGRRLGADLDRRRRHRAGIAHLTGSRRAPLPPLAGRSSLLARVLLRGRVRAGAAVRNAQGVLRLLPADAVSEKTITLAGPHARLHRDRRHARALRPERREERRGVLHRLCRQGRRHARAAPSPSRSTAGPGAASAYLHLGLAGPRIVDFGPQGRDGAAAKLVDNPDTWLAFTDLVIIDPIGTGWSRTAKPDGASAFCGVRRDAEMLAKVIALYVAQQQPQRFAEIPARRKLRRLPRRQGGARAAERAGHRRRRHRHGVADAGDRRCNGRGASNALGAALHFPSIAAAELDRTGTYTPRRDGRDRALRAQRISPDARRPAAAGRARRARSTAASRR